MGPGLELDNINDFKVDSIIYSSLTKMKKYNKKLLFLCFSQIFFITFFFKNPIHLLKGKNHQLVLLVFLVVATQHNHHFYIHIPVETVPQTILSHLLSYNSIFSCHTHLPHFVRIGGRLLLHI